MGNKDCIFYNEKYENKCDKDDCSCDIFKIKSTMDKETKFLVWVAENKYRLGALGRWWKWYDKWLVYKNGSKAKGLLSFSEKQLFDLYNNKKISHDTR